MEEDGKWGYINKSGKYEITPRYDFCKGFVGGLANVTEGNRSGYVNKAEAFVWQSPRL